jgi:hypothetical protein
MPKAKEKEKGRDKNPNAVALGRLGGSKGGLARARNMRLRLSNKQISAMAKKASIAGVAARRKKAALRKKAAAAGR